MSTARTDEPEATEEQSTPATWWAGVNDYWGRVWGLTWRTVFPPREDYR